MYPNIKFIVNEYHSILSHQFSLIAAKTPGLKKIYFNTKGKNKSEFGYYVNHDPATILTIMRKLGKNKLLDLGCGAGLLLKSIRIGSLASKNDIVVSGYDNE